MRLCCRCHIVAPSSFLHSGRSLHEQASANHDPHLQVVGGALHVDRHEGKDMLKCSPPLNGDVVQTRMTMARGGRGGGGCGRVAFCLSCFSRQPLDRGKSPVTSAS